MTCSFLVLQNDVSFLALRHQPFNRSNDMFWKPHKTTCHFFQTTKPNITPYDMSFCTKQHVDFPERQLLLCLNDMSFFVVVFFFFLTRFWPISNSAFYTPFWAIQIAKLSQIQLPYDPWPPYAQKNSKFENLNLKT